MHCLYKKTWCRSGTDVIRDDCNRFLNPHTVRVYKYPYTCEIWAHGNGFSSLLYTDPNLAMGVIVRVLITIRSLIRVEASYHPSSRFLHRHAEMIFFVLSLAFRLNIPSSMGFNAFSINMMFKFIDKNKYFIIQVGFIR